MITTKVFFTLQKELSMKMYTHECKLSNICVRSLLRRVVNNDVKIFMNIRNLSGIIGPWVLTLTLLLAYHLAWAWGLIQVPPIFICKMQIVIAALPTS